MDKKRIVRNVVIAVILLCGVYWSLASARPGSDYPESAYLGYCPLAETAYG